MSQQWKAFADVRWKLSDGIVRKVQMRYETCLEMVFRFFGLLDVVVREVEPFKMMAAVEYIVGNGSQLIVTQNELFQAFHVVVQTTRQLDQLVLAEIEIFHRKKVTRDRG